MDAPSSQNSGPAVGPSPLASLPADWFGLGPLVSAFVQIIRKRILGFVLTAVALTGLSAVWVYRQPRLYQGTAAIVIDPAPPQIFQGVKEVVEMGTGGLLGNREFYETQYRIIQSKEIAQRVVQKLGLANDATFPSPEVRKANPNLDLAKVVVQQIKVAPVRDSRIANIVVTDRDFKRAAEIANAVAEAYIETNLTYKLEGTRSAATFLSDKVVDLDEKLKVSEIKLYEYRRAKQLLDVGLDARQSMNTQNVQTYNQKLADARAKRIELESMRRLVVAAMGNISEQESLPIIRENSVVQQLRVSFFELSRTKADLEAQYGDKHPKIEALRGRLAAIKHDYESEISKILKANDKAYQAVVDYEKALVELMKQERKEAIELAKVEVEYRPLARQRDNDEKLFTLVQQREKETSLTGLVRANNVRLLDAAEPDSRPVKPRVVATILVGLAAGLIFGIGVAFALEGLDSTLRTQEEVEALLGVPVLGLVPIIGQKRKKNQKPTAAEDTERALAVFKSPKSSAAEACRSIRTNLLFLSPDRPLRSLVVTSPGPQEGKTTTAINLAITMAQAGNRVLLVDTDMRRPRVDRALGMRKDRGISNVIVGEERIEDVIVKTDIPNLDILPCGAIPPNPAELLHTDSFTRLMKSCEERYDRVLYDTPPTSAVTDPAIIGNLVDGVLLVLRAGATSREAAGFARRQLADAKAKVLGAIINCVDLTDRNYNYYYARYYRAYGYGYYTTPEDAAKA